MSSAPLAVSAVVHPSRLLRLALAAYACACLGAAIALAWGGAGAFRFAHWAAAACLATAALALHAIAGIKTKRRIDISGVGQIRVTVQLDIGISCVDGVPVRLVQGSTVWPCAMVLLLRGDDDGAVTVLTILPDSVAPHQFRALAVAIRAIAGRNNTFFGANKIL